MVDRAWELALLGSMFWCRGLRSQNSKSEPCFQAPYKGISVKGEGQNIFHFKVC